MTAPVAELGRFSDRAVDPAAPKQPAPARACSTRSGSSPAPSASPALGTVFFARAGHPSAHSYLAAAELVFGIAAGLDLLTLLLVGLLPKHAQRAHG